MNTKRNPAKQLFLTFFALTMPLMATSGTQIDVTSQIVNPDFSQDNTSGWTYGFAAVTNLGYQHRSHTKHATTINQFAEGWISGGFLGDGSIEQTIHMLPAGAYALSADIVATNQFDGGEKATSGFYLFAKEVGESITSIEVATENMQPEHFQLIFDKSDDLTDLTFGVMAQNATGNWLAADNFALMPLNISSYTTDGIEKVFSDEHNIDIEVSYLAHKDNTSEEIMRFINIISPSGVLYDIDSGNLGNHSIINDNLFFQDGYTYIDLQNIEKGKWHLKLVQKNAGDWYYYIHNHLIPTDLSIYTTDGIEKVFSDEHNIDIEVSYLAHKDNTSKDIMRYTIITSPSGVLYDIDSGNLGNHSIINDNLFFQDGYTYIDLQNIEKGKWHLKLVQKNAGDWYYYNYNEPRILNPDFSGSSIGWTYSFEKFTNVGYQSNKVYTNPALTISKFIESWRAGNQPLGDGFIEQTIKYLPAGTYTLTSDIIATNQSGGEQATSGFHLFATENGTTPTTTSIELATENGKPEHFKLTFNKKEDATTLTLGVMAKNATGNWLAADNFTLSYNNAAIDENQKCGDNVYYTYDNSTSTLTILGFGPMYEYDSNDEEASPWKESRTSIKNIIVKPGVTNISSYAFYGCESLISITVPESVTSIGSSAFAQCSSLTSITIPENVTSIGIEAFSECTNLQSLEIPEGVTSIEDWTFRACSSLKSITIPASVVHISPRAALRCSSLSNIYIDEKNPKYRDADNKAIVTGDTLFTGCTSGYIPEGIKVIGDYAFWGRVIESSHLEVPEGITSIEMCAFTECQATSIHLPKSLKKCDTYSFVYFGNYPIYIKEIHIDDLEAWFDIDFDYDGANPLETGADFYVDGELMQSITTPAGIKVIKPSALAGWQGKELTISEGVTTIEDFAFGSCNRLTTVTIPKSVTSIGVQAFMFCSSLEDVYCYTESVPTTHEKAFEDAYPENATLHVLMSALTSFKATSPWNSFGTITGIEEYTKIAINKYGSGTYSSKYALDFSAVEGLKAYAATGYNSGTGVITLTRVMTAQPNTGLFVKGDPGVTYNVPVMEMSLDHTINMLVATPKSTTVNKLSDDGLYANYRYTTKSGNPNPLFYEIADGYTMSAGKAYLQIPVAWMPTANKAISYRFDEGTTGMEDVEDVERQEAPIYDLMGRRVTAPQKGMLYLKNGQKFIY